jgi:hypothetical protein
LDPLASRLPPLRIAPKTTENGEAVLALLLPLQHVFDSWRCSMRLLQIGIPVAILSALLWLSPLKAQQPGTHYPTQTMPQTGAPAMNTDKVIADMQASDARLQAMTAKMQSAQGEAKMLAMQDVVNELVKNQLEMHRHMAMMRGHMMESAPK